MGAELLAAVPGIPCEAEAPVFAEPRQAQTFAIALMLQQKGVFTWAERADALGKKIRIALAGGDPDEGSNYYDRWLETLEGIIAAKGIAGPDTLAKYYDAWDHAAHRTPHGEAIELAPGDFH